MIPRHSSLGSGFRFITAKGLPSFVQHSFRFHGLIQDTHVGSYTQGRIAGGFLPGRKRRLKPKSSLSGKMHPENHRTRT
jgi:hypothetical protein